MFITDIRAGINGTKSKLTCVVSHYEWYLSKRSKIIKEKTNCVRIRDGKRMERRLFFLGLRVRYIAANRTDVFFLRTVRYAKTQQDTCNVKKRFWDNKNKSLCICIFIFRPTHLIHSSTSSSVFDRWLPVSGNMRTLSPPMTLTMPNTNNGNILLTSDCEKNRNSNKLRKTVKALMHFFLHYIYIHYELHWPIIDL